MEINCNISDISPCQCFDGWWWCDPICQTSVLHSASFYPSVHVDPCVTSGSDFKQKQPRITFPRTFCWLILHNCKCKFLCVIISFTKTHVGQLGSLNSSLNSFHQLVTLVSNGFEIFAKKYCRLNNQNLLYSKFQGRRI